MTRRTVKTRTRGRRDGQSRIDHYSVNETEEPRTVT